MIALKPKKFNFNKNFGCMIQNREQIKLIMKKPDAYKLC